MLRPIDIKSNINWKGIQDYYVMRGKEHDFLNRTPEQIRAGHELYHFRCVRKLHGKSYTDDVGEELFACLDGASLRSWHIHLAPTYRKFVPWITQFLKDYPQFDNPGFTTAYAEISGDVLPHDDLESSYTKLNIIETGHPEDYTWIDKGNKISKHYHVPGSAYLVDSKYSHGAVVKHDFKFLQIGFKRQPFEEVSEALPKSLDYSKIN